MEAYEELIDCINIMLNEMDDCFDFADETLEGIRDTVTNSEVVTPGQAQAVRNILESCHWCIEKYFLEDDYRRAEMALSRVRDNL